MKANKFATVKYLQIMSALVIECRLKYPLPFKTLHRSQARFFADALYGKIVRSFIFSHKTTLYRGRISKTTLKAFRGWTFEGELQ